MGAMSASAIDDDAAACQTLEEALARIEAMLRQHKGEEQAPVAWLTS